MRIVDPLVHVMQNDRNSGCGTACIAMVARTDYEQARCKIFNEKTDDLYIWKWKDMRSYLDMMGVSHAPKAVRAPSWEKFNCFAIVWCMSKVEREREREPKEWKVGHYVVYDPCRGVIHDPLKRSAVTCSRIRRHPISYLEINLS